MPEVSIHVVTGERGAGKSTLCKRIATEAGRRGLSVAGLITERLGDAPGSPRRVIDLASGESRLFGSQHGTPGSSAPAARGPDPLTPWWEYDHGVFAWANAALLRSTPCDLLVVDEVGPLELQGKRGWVGALDALRSGDFNAALVVCRPALLPDLTGQLGPRPVVVVEVDVETRDGLATTLLERILPAGR
jgi:nucleoside-triphosphatase